MNIDEIKNNKPKKPLVAYWVIVLAVMLVMNFVIFPWRSEEHTSELQSR